MMRRFGEHCDLMEKVGSYKAGKRCLYINNLAKVDLAVLEKLIMRSVTNMREKYPRGEI